METALLYWCVRQLITYYPARDIFCPVLCIYSLLCHPLLKATTVLFRYFKGLFHSHSSFHEPSTRFSVLHSAHDGEIKQQSINGFLFSWHTFPAQQALSASPPSAKHLQRHCVDIHTLHASSVNITERFGYATTPLYATNLEDILEDSHGIDADRHIAPAKGLVLYELHPLLFHEFDERYYGEPEDIEPHWEHLLERRLFTDVPVSKFKSRW
jgi:hypothetical protein